MLRGKLPDLSVLKPFGSKAYIHREVGELGRKAKFGKGNEKGLPGFWVGYAADRGQKGHMIYIPETQKILIRKHVRIYEATSFNPDLQICEEC